MRTDPSPASRPRRSVLFCPALNERAVTKLRSLPVDCFILDLEDSVAPAAKENARAALASASLDGVLLPKIAGPQDVAAARAILARGGAPAALPLWLMIETPRAV